MTFAVFRRDNILFPAPTLVFKRIGHGHRSGCLLEMHFSPTSCLGIHSHWPSMSEYVSPCASEASATTGKTSQGPAMQEGPLQPL